MVCAVDSQESIGVFHWLQGTYGHSVLRRSDKVTLKLWEEKLYVFGQSPLYDFMCVVSLVQLSRNEGTHVLRTPVSDQILHIDNYLHATS